MSERYIALALGGLSLVIPGRRIVGNRYPRITAESGENQRSSYGAFVGYGLAQEAPHLWEFTALLTEREAEIIEGMYRQHQANKRTGATQNPRILLTDATRRLTEPSPRSRATAPNPFHQVLSLDASQVAYFGQYYVWFAAPPEFGDSGRYLGTQISLEETDEKVAP